MHLGYNRNAMTWKLIGNAWAEALLRGHMQDGRLRHAYLLTGPRQVGKRTLALRFAQALNCERHAGSGELCDPAQRAPCRACRLTPEERYPDLHVLRPEDGGAGIRVEQIRELQRQLALAPFEGHWRIALLPEFQRASHSAANALLKTLEEPPDQVLLLLTAPAAESLLPTIVSRCELLALRALPMAELSAALHARGLPAEQAALLAGVSGGRPGRALQLTRSAEDLAQREQLLEDLWQLLGDTRSRRFAYVHKALRATEAEGRRQQARELLDTWLSAWRDAVLLAHGEQVPLSNPDQRPRAQWLAKQIPPEQLLQGLRQIDATLGSIDSNVNLRLALETLMLDLPFIEERPVDAG